MSHTIPPPFRVALVGDGDLARDHHRRWHRQPAAPIVDPSSPEHESGEKPALWDLCVPAAERAPLLGRLLRQRDNAICLPGCPADTSRDAQRLAHAARKHRVALTILHLLRVAPPHARLKELLESECLGPLRQLHIALTFAAACSHEDTWDTPNPREAFFAAVDLALWLAGPDAEPQASERDDTVRWQTGEGACVCVQVLPAKMPGTDEGTGACRVTLAGSLGRASSHLELHRDGSHPGILRTRHASWSHTLAEHTRTEPLPDADLLTLELAALRDADGGRAPHHMLCTAPHAEIVCRLLPEPHTPAP